MWDQDWADWTDPHALIDDTVQVRQTPTVGHVHCPFTAHLFVQFLLHTTLHLEKEQGPVQCNV